MVSEYKRGIKKPGVHMARQAFLYGDSTGNPVTNVARLAEIAECHENTIRAHLPKWVVEREEIVAGGNEAGLSLHLSKETLARHKSDLEFIRAKLDETQLEIERLPLITEQLEGWLAAFREDDADKAVRMFNSYIRTSLNKKALITLFQSLHRQWTQYAGIDSLTVVAEAREKAMSVGRAKIALKAEEARPQGPDSATPAAQGRFGHLVETTPAPILEDDDEVGL